MHIKSHYKLKNGSSIELREGEPSDAAACLKYIEKVSAQSTFLTFGPGEFGLSLKEEEKVILDKKDRVNELFLLACIDSVIVSQMTVNSSQRLRIRHAVEFGISVDKEYWGLGIGTAMLEYLLSWAETNPVVRKVNLQVLESNEKAIHLYKRLGFTLEGKKLKDNYQDGVYSDVLLMGKWFEK